MYVGRDFSPMERIESEVFGFDFVQDLEPDETLISSVWELKVVAGVDDDPADHLSGGSKVVAPDGSNAITATIQRIGGLHPGVTYLVRAVAITSDGNTKSLWAHIRGVADDV